MPSSGYHDLPEFGLPFVTPEDPKFPGLVQEIQKRPQPFGLQPTGDLSNAAVLLNLSGKAIVTLAYMWRYTMSDGRTRTSRHSNLGSSMQMDALTGRSGVAHDRGSFILSGSKRLITQEGMFGDNFDVIPESGIHSGSYVGMGAAGRLRTGPDDQKVARIELYLDVVFFDDGLCVGPDEFSLFESVTDDLELRGKTAQEIVEALRNGTSAGRVFEMLQPLARHGGPDAIGVRRGHPRPLLTMFANMAINRLINLSGPELLAWFEGASAPSPIRLHRP